MKWRRAIVETFAWVFVVVVALILVAIITTLVGCGSADSGLTNVCEKEAQDCSVVPGAPTPSHYGPVPTKE